MNLTDLKKRVLKLLLIGKNVIKNSIFLFDSKTKQNLLSIEFSY